MKQYFATKAVFAAVLLLSVPALTFAQDDQEQKERPEKTERPEKRERVEVRERTEKKEKPEKAENVQQIIITRKGDKNDKTVIEIKGNKVLVNGKDASKMNDVTVNLNNLNDIRAMHWNGINNGRNFNFDFNNDMNFDDDHITSLFSEDANRAMLGVTTDEDEKGAKITAITRESAASKAGLKVGDVITKIGDANIENADDVSKAVRQHKPGDKVSVSILRDGKQQTINAELGKWKGVRINNLNATIAPMPQMNFTQPNSWTYNFGKGPKLGLSVQETEDGKGVKVLNVADDSNAAKAGVKKDDVITKINDDEVNTTDEVVEAMQNASDEKSVKFDVLRDGKQQTIEIYMPRDLKKTDL